MDTLAPLFLSMGEPLDYYLTLPSQSYLLQSSFSQFHGPTIYATKGDRLNVCYPAPHPLYLLIPV